MYNIEFDGLQLYNADRNTYVSSFSTYYSTKCTILERIYNSFLQNFVIEVNF
mgnify:CR=1 FL=1